MVDTKELLAILQTPVSPSVNNTIIAQADYREASNRILELNHLILEKNKEIETVWTAKRRELNQRLGLKVYQKDVQQVPQPSSPPAAAAASLDYVIVAGGVDKGAMGIG